jgi:hypothetical protein
MASDPRLKAAIAHWGPRFVANGVTLTDFEEVTGSLKSYDDWCRAWSERAAHHEQLGREALTRGYTLTAGECLQRAGVYYHFAAFLFVHDVPQMKAAHMKAIECRQAALPHLRPPGERLQIPYEGKMLAGILRKPPGYDKPPVVVMAVGLDSTKEETDAYEAPFLARGMATLVFEGPGQGEAQYDFAIRGDYEVPTKAVIDYVAMRRDLDVSRVGMWGVSLGGYYAPRLRRGLGRPTGIDARGLPRAQPMRDARPGAQERRHAVVGGDRGQHHLPDLHRERPARPHHSGRRRRAAGARGQRPGRIDDDRGRQPHRHQPRLPLAFPERRLDGGAVTVAVKPFSAAPRSCRARRARPATTAD